MESFVKILCFCGITFCLGGSLSMTAISIYHATLWFYKSQTFLSLVFISKAIGYMVGSIITWWFFKRSNQVIVSSMSLLGLAVTVLAFPTTSEYMYLFVLLVLYGICVEIFKSSFQNLLGINYSRTSYIPKIADVFFSLGYVFTLAIIIFFCNPPFDHPSSTSLSNSTIKLPNISNSTQSINTETPFKKFKRSVDDSSNLTFTDNTNGTTGIIKNNSPITSATPPSTSKLETTTIPTTKSISTTTTNSTKKILLTTTTSPTTKSISTTTTSSTTKSTLSTTSSLVTTIGINNTNQTTSSTTTTSTKAITRPEFIDSNNDNHHKDFASGQSIKQDLKDSLNKHPIDADLNDHHFTSSPTTPPINQTLNATMDGNTTFTRNHIAGYEAFSTTKTVTGVEIVNNQSSSKDNITNTTSTIFIKSTAPPPLPPSSTLITTTIKSTVPTDTITTTISTVSRLTTINTVIHNTASPLPATSLPSTTHATTVIHTTTKGVSKVSNIDVRTSKPTPVTTHSTGIYSVEPTVSATVSVSIKTASEDKVTPPNEHKVIDEEDKGLKLKIACLEWVDHTANKLTFHHIPYFLGFFFISFIMLFMSAFLFLANRNSSKIMLYRHVSENTYTLAGSGHLSTLIMTPLRTFFARLGVFIFHWSFSSFEVLLAGVFMVFFLSIPGTEVTVSLVGCLMLWLFHFAGKVFLLFLVSTIASNGTLSWIGSVGMLLSCLCYYPIFYHPSNQTIDCLPLSLVIFSTSFFFSFINPSVIDYYNKLNVLSRIHLVQQVATFLGELTTPAITTYLVLASDIDYFLHSISTISFILLLSLCLIHLSFPNTLSKRESSRKKNDHKVTYKKRNSKKSSFDNAVLITNDEEDDDDYEVSNETALNGHSTTKPLLLS